MFERFHAFFQKLTVDNPKKGFAPYDPRITVAALCMQVMEAPGVAVVAEGLVRIGIAFGEQIG
ncbi:hypothetical protein AB9F46_35905, partial [Rhizobium leguminosarum]